MSLCSVFAISSQYCDWRLSSEPPTSKILSWHHLASAKPDLSMFHVEVKWTKDEKLWQLYKINQNNIKTCIRWSPETPPCLSFPNKLCEDLGEGATATVLRAETEKASQSVQSTDRIDMSLYTVPHCHTPFQSVVGRLAFSWDGSPKLHHHHISQPLHNSSFFEAPKEDSVLLLRQGPICYSATTWKNATKIWFKLQDSLPLQSCVPTFAWMISKIYKCTRGFCELIRTESCRWNVPWFPVLCAGSSYHLKVIHSEASLLKCHRPSEVLQCELWSSAGPHFSKRQADSAYGGWGSEHFKCR